MSAHYAVVIKVIYLASLLFATNAYAQELDGLWKVGDKATWVRIETLAGVAAGQVVRSEVKPEAVGRIVLKDIRPLADAKLQWRGQVYAERFQRFTDAAISLPASDTMNISVKVGFITRTLVWTRVEDMP